MTSNPIRELNDAFRTGYPNGDWNYTNGLFHKGLMFVGLAIASVRKFSTFSEDNDPYDEHDFGSFDLQGEKLFWKIDYYNPDLSAGSEDPADPAKTRRVMTIMLASEY